MSYSCIDGYDTLMGVAQSLPHYDHNAESELDDDDVSGVVDLALEAFEREAQQKAATSQAARTMLAALQEIVKLSTNLGDGEDEPDFEEWDSMQDAEDEGYRMSAYNAASLARAAIEAAKAAGITPAAG